MNSSVSQSVCWSVGLLHFLSLCFHHRSIMKFSGVNTIDRSDVHANGQGQRSKVKVTEVKTQFSRFRTITPVWIHMWRWNDAQSLMWHRIGALFFFKVIHQISRLHGTKKSPILTWIEHFWTVTPVWIHRWLWNDAQSLTYSTANKNFAFLAGNGWAGLSAERPLPARAGHLWYSHLLSRWRHL